MADTPEERICECGHPRRRHGGSNEAGRCDHGCCWHDCYQASPSDAALREAEARGFAKGLEAAAQLCEQDARRCGWAGAADYDDALSDVARLIRALAPKAPPEVAAAEPKP